MTRAAPRLPTSGRAFPPQPARLIRPGSGSLDGAEREFSFFGPTCDSFDRMRGPFLLPADTREGDWIEIGQLGAYGACLRTGFNGFDRAGLVEVGDGPLPGTPDHPVRADCGESDRQAA